MKTGKKLLEKKQEIKNQMDALFGKQESDSLWKKAEVKLDQILKDYEKIPKGERLH